MCEWCEGVDTSKSVLNIAMVTGCLAANSLALMTVQRSCESINTLCCLCVWCVWCVLCVVCDTFTCEEESEAVSQ